MKLLTIEVASHVKKTAILAYIYIFLIGLKHSSSAN